MQQCQPLYAHSSTPTPVFRISRTKLSKTLTKIETTSDSVLPGKGELRRWSKFLGRDNSDHGLSLGCFWCRGRRGGSQPPLCGLSTTPCRGVFYKISEAPKRRKRQQGGRGVLEAGETTQEAEYQATKKSNNHKQLVSLSPKAGHPKAGRSDFRNQRFKPDTAKMRKMRTSLPPQENKGLRRHRSTKTRKTRKMRKMRTRKRGKCGKCG